MRVGCDSLLVHHPPWHNGFCVLLKTCLGYTRMILLHPYQQITTFFIIDMEGQLGGNFTELPKHIETMN
jgi:hypothetical protein